MLVQLFYFLLNFKNDNITDIEVLNPPPPNFYNLCNYFLLLFGGNKLHPYISIIEINYSHLILKIMKLTLTPEQIDLLIQKEKEVLSIHKEKAILEFQKQFTVAIAETEKKFNIAVAKLAGKYKTVEVSITTDDLEVPAIDEKETEYLKASRSIAAKLTKARKIEGNEAEVKKLENERTALNAKFGKKGRK